MKMRCDDTEPLVLAHQNLVPENMILGKDGRLWIVGWSSAGYYPPWFEFVAMQQQAKAEGGGLSVAFLLKKRTPFVIYA